MAKARKPFQGIRNIVRFNWHFYVVAALAIGAALVAAEHVPSGYDLLFQAIAFAATLAISISLLVSLYIYDLSGFYNRDWLEDLELATSGRVINVSAGFDETSAILRDRLPSVSLTAFDFYDPIRHTEVSIRRARNAYPPFPGTFTTSTSRLSLPNDHSDTTFVMFAAHEIRDEAERMQFFRELNRTLHPDGRIVVVEHLRNAANFFAYTVGAFHFFPRSSWLRVFSANQLQVSRERKITPFVTLFVLKKHGDSPHDHRSTTAGACRIASDLPEIL